MVIVPSSCTSLQDVAVTLRMVHRPSPAASVITCPLLRKLPAIKHRLAIQFRQKTDESNSDFVDIAAEARKACSDRCLCARGVELDGSRTNRATTPRARPRDDGERRPDPRPAALEGPIAIAAAEGRAQQRELAGDRCRRPACRALRPGLSVPPRVPRARGDGGARRACGRLRARGPLCRAGLMVIGLLGAEDLRRCRCARQCRPRSPR